MSDLSPVVIPVIAAVILSVSGSWVVSRFSSPAQTAYVAALEGRLNLVTKDKDEAWSRVTKLEARILVLEQQVQELRDVAGEKDREIARLYRRLDADEKRLLHDERRITSDP